MSDTSFLNKTDDEIREEVLEIGKEQMGISNYKSTGVLRGLLETLALLVIRIYTKFLVPLSRQTNRSTATGFWLDVHGNNLGVKREDAGKTSGTLIGTAYKSGTLKSGAWIKVAGTDLRFKVSEEVAFFVGDFGIPVTAEFPGTYYNVTSDSSFVLTSVVSGIEAVSAGKDWISKSGTDIEDDETYRERIEAKWTAQGEGNNASKYKKVAMSVAGITAVKVVRTPRGYGSIDVIIAGSAGLPTEEQLEAVNSALEDYSMICRDLVVRAPKSVDTDIEIEFSGDYTEEDVKNTALNWIVSLGIGACLEIRDLYNEPWDDYDFNSFEIISPTRNISVEENEMIVPSITATKVDA